MHISLLLRITGLFLAISASFTYSASVTEDYRSKVQQLHGYIRQKNFRDAQKFEAEIAELQVAFNRDPIDSKDDRLRALMLEHCQQLRLAFRAKNGDATAFAQLKAFGPLAGRLYLYAQLGTQDAVSELAQVAADKSQDFEMRYQAVRLLGTLKDKRAIEIGLSDEFVQQLKPWSLKRYGDEMSLGGFLYEISGEDNPAAREEFLKVRNVQEARDLLLDRTNTKTMKPAQPRARTPSSRTAHSIARPDNEIARPQ